MSSQLKEFKQPNEAEGESFPSFVKPPHDETGYEDSRLELRCKVEGNPFPKVVWRKGKWLQIDDGGRYDVTKNHETGLCIMAIKSARPTDLGKYRVVATNDFGEVTHTFEIKVNKKLNEFEKVNLVHSPRKDKSEKKKKDDGDQGTKYRNLLQPTKVPQKHKKTAEELEKEVLEILKTADPKNYEKICMEHGFYDFRMILKKLEKLKRVEVPQEQPGFVRILKELRHVTVNDEGTAVFEMHMENLSPEKHLVWFKDGELVQIPGVEKRHELRRVGNVVQLIIRNANPSDAGTYTLDIGGQKFDAVLTIKEKILEFGTKLKNQIGKVHGRCVFECSTTRRGQLVTWYKDGKALNLRGGTARLQAVSEGKSHKLIITELNLKDSGVYSAKIGDLETKAELKVQAAPIRFHNRLVHTEVKEKTSATFECSVSSKDAKAVWTVNGEEVKNGGRYVIKSGDIHSLTIKKVGLADDKAVVKVTFGEASSKAELRVVAKPIKMISKLHDVKCRVGQPVEFTCEIDDPDADASVEWFKDDKPIKPSGKYEMKKVKGKYTLKIKSSSVVDEGIYQFQIRGVRSEAELVCSDPPMVDKAFMERLKKKPLRFKVGTKAKIEIPFSGKTPHTVCWTNGRVTLEDRGRYKMSHTDKVAVLTVDSCKISDAGVYELTIINENGEMNIEIPVKIVAKPHPPSGEIAISDIGQDSTALSWNPPIDDQVPVDEYVIEIKDKSGKWKPLAKVPSDITNYQAKGLKEGEEYQFRVKSSNEEGFSEPLESKAVTPIAPDVPPQIDPKIIEQLEKNPIVVKAGETATIRIPCKGNPPPSAAWMHNGEEIIPVKHHRATKTSTTNEVVLKISKCQTSDSGQYEARVFNNVGGVLVKTKIVVKDVPDFSKAAINFDNVSPNEVTMSWKAPTEDGGSPVKAYVVERCIAGKNRWEKVGDCKANATSFTCKNCQAEATYVFRVKAVNEQGQSEPAVSEPVTCGAQLIAPKLDPDILKQLTENPIRVKAGQTGRLKVPISGGQPPPTVIWEKDGEPLQADGKRVVCIPERKNATAILHKCQKSDSGTYLCKIKNDAGVVEVPLQVQVLDVPEAPSGPIEFTDISAKGVTLSWSPTKDDGGSPITHYIIEKKEEGRKVWTSVGKTSDGKATSFRATNVPAGKTYEFRVRAVSEIGESESNVSKLVTVKDPYDPPSPVTGSIEMDSSTGNSISISWNKVKSDGGSAVLGYVIEKRKKGTSSWTRCNDLNNLCVGEKYTADNLRCDMEYEFRVIAVNAAGESDPSRASKAFLAQDPGDAPGQISDLELIDSTNSSLTFQWKGTDVHGGADFLGYDIELQKDGTDNWIKFNDNHITGTSYTVRGLEQGAAYYVRIRSINMRTYGTWFRYKGTFIAHEFHVAPTFKMTSELEAVVRDGFHINAGGTIRIHVPYHARPRPVITWTKNDQELDETVNIIDNDGVSQLTIRNCSGKHSGSYKVTLTNASGSQSLTVRVLVSDVPSAPKGPLEATLNGSEVQLSWRAPVHVGDGETIRYIIQKRDARGRDWSTVAQNLRTNSFTISDLEKLRSYYFRVLAENHIGKSEALQTTNIIYIKQHVGYPEHVIKSFMAKKMQQFTHCLNLDSKDASYIFVSHGSVLLLPGLKMRPEIENVSYDEKDLRQPPQVTVPLKARKVPEGVKVTMSCSVSGKPDPTIRWFKDNREVTEDSNYFKENVMGLCRLVLTNVKPSDSGRYKITAESAVGKAISEADLIVSDY